MPVKTSYLLRQYKQKATYWKYFQEVYNASIYQVKANANDSQGDVSIVACIEYKAVCTYSLKNGTSSLNGHVCSMLLLVTLMYDSFLRTSQGLNNLLLCNGWDLHKFCNTFST